MNHGVEIKQNEMPSMRLKALVLVLLMWGSTDVIAAEPLHKAIPNTKHTYNIPAGDLSDTLPGYAAQSGVLLGFDPKLTQGKRSPVLHGHILLMKVSRPSSKAAAWKWCKTRPDVTNCKRP